MLVSNQNLSEILKIFANTSIKFEPVISCNNGIKEKESNVCMIAAKKMENILGKLCLENRPKI